jgi:two-component system sensor histidine kinase/response regulator
MIGWGWQKVHHPDHVQRVVEKISRCFREGLVWEDTFPLLGRDGIYRWFLSRAVPVTDEHGKILRWFGTNTDITDKEGELVVARDQALDSVRLKSQFLANVSHEIRTPMNGVIGMTGLLLDTDLSDQQRHYAETIHSSGESLLRVINDILDFSKIEAGKLEFEVLDFNLHEAVESTLELLAHLAHSKQLELTSLIAGDVPVNLRGDPGRFRQVLTNLLNNAIKFTEVGGVMLTATTVEANEHSVVIRFNVSDTGPGISEDTEKQLFRVFTQGDGSTSRKYGGTGLGLAISKQLVELMHGQIGVTSNATGGSSFWFTARFEKQPKLAHSQPTVTNLQGLRVLVVDDNSVSRNILMHQVSSFGMIAHQAESGAQALGLLRAAAAHAPFRVAILDLVMPGMDGFDLAEAIRADGAIPEIDVMLLLSYGQLGDGPRARDAGISG